MTIDNYNFRQTLLGAKGMPRTQLTALLDPKWLEQQMYIYPPAPRRGCHPAAEEQCSSYRTFYVTTVHCPSLIADCLVFDWYTVQPTCNKSPYTLAVTWIPGSRQNSAPARTGVPSSPFWRPRASPGPRPSPWHLQGPPT